MNDLQYPAVEHHFWRRTVLLQLVVPMAFGEALVSEPRQRGRADTKFFPRKRPFNPLNPII